MYVHSRIKLALSIGALVLLASPALAGYSEGMECYKSADYDCAITEFGTEVQAHPEYDFGWFMIGVSHLKKKDYAKSIENLNKAIEINGNKLSYHLNKAKAYIDQAQFDKVIETLAGKEELSGSAGETYNLNYQLGTAYHQQKEHAKAIPFLEKAVAVKPDFKTFFMLGISYDNVGDSAKSIATLKEALKQKPGDSEVQFQLATAYLGLAQREPNKDKKSQLYTEAVTYGEKAVKASPNDFRRQNTLARAYFGADRFAEAEGTFKKALQIKPDYCFAQVNLGGVYIARKQWNDAVKILLDATKCDSGNNVAWENLGFAQEKLYKGLPTEQAKISQLEKALASFQKAAALKSSRSTTDAIERIRNNIEIAEQNIRIAEANIRTMEKNLEALRKGVDEINAQIEKIAKQRQFFLDKNQWPPEKEQEYQKEKANLESLLADREKEIKRQEEELKAAREAQNPA